MEAAVVIGLVLLGGAIGAALSVFGLRRWVQAIEAENATTTEALEKSRSLVDAAQADIDGLHIREKERELELEGLRALRSIHSLDTRVGSFHIDPVQMTARLRRIHPGLRAEFDGQVLEIRFRAREDKATVDPAVMNRIKAFFKSWADMDVT